MGSRVRANEEIGDDAPAFSATLEIKMKDIAGAQGTLGGRTEESKLPVAQEFFD